MKVTKPILFIFLYTWCCTNCAQNHTQTSLSNIISADTLTTFMLPAIPPTLTIPEQRAQFLAAHYWDLINLTDTNYTHHPEITEQGWVNFIDLLRLVQPDDAATALKKIIRQASTEKKSLLYFMQLAEKYLYEPNSPIRNEEYYLSVLQAVVDSPILTDAEKLRSNDQLQTIQLNQVGTRANNFCYTQPSGQQQWLYQLKAPYTLLFFSNPECHACLEAIDQMTELEHLNRAIQQKQLIVLSIYPDEDVQSWKLNLDRYPKNWLHAYDKKQVIKDKNLYDLKAIPCLYLLDKDKNVLLKDATPAAVDDWLSDHP